MRVDDVLKKNLDKSMAKRLSKRPRLVKKFANIYNDLCPVCTKLVLSDVGKGVKPRTELFCSDCQDKIRADLEYIYERLKK